jgi:general secretion pathway protein I
MRRKGGFTLIEVLLALMVFGLTAVVLGASYLNVLNSYEAAQRSNQDGDEIAFARSQLLVIADLPTAEAGQEFDDGNRHVKWTAGADPTTTTDLFTVTFTCVISPSGAAAPRTVVETFMLVRPTWSDPTERTTLRQNAANRIALFQGKQPSP